MIESSKDKINLISCAVSVIGLIFIIVGVYPIVLPLMLFGGFFGGFGGLIMAILFPVLFVLMQGIIIFAMFMSIKNKGFASPKTLEIVSIRKVTITSSTINLVFILIAIFMSGVFFYAPINGMLLILTPIITIAAGMIFQEYK